jgi:hypothetical protein
MNDMARHSRIEAHCSMPMVHARENQNGRVRVRRSRQGHLIIPAQNENRTPV